MGLKQMKLILFDLDGTLLTGGGIGRQSTRKALEAVFGSSGILDEIYPGGRTQEAIFLDTLLEAGFTEWDYAARRDQLYQVFLEEFKRAAGESNGRINPLPGAINLIQILTGLEEVHLGVVTGNHRQNAEIKLQSAGFEPGWFAVGAYGEESADRSKLIPLAQKRAEEQIGVSFPGAQLVVVGDTTRDIASARKAGAVSIAVTTGSDDRALLISASPDYLLDSLEDPQPILEILAEI